jgi:hypothetical protein
MFPSKYIYKLVYCRARGISKWLLCRVGSMRKNLEGSKQNMIYYYMIAPCEHEIHSDIH